MESGKIYYAKHIEAGLVNYGTQNVLVSNETLVRMNKSFQGKPVYVEHDDNQKSTVSEDAVGYVIRSFFNEVDGTHWAEILITETIGEQKIVSGYKVSNSYSNLEYSPMGGEWHNIPYDREILDGRYEHLALVRNPRYEDAVIFDAEGFNAYCDDKRRQLESLKNSKDFQTGDGKMAETVNIDGDEISVEELVRRYKEALEKLKDPHSDDDSEDNEKDDVPAEETGNGPKESKDSPKETSEEDRDDGPKDTVPAEKDPDNDEFEDNVRNDDFLQQLYNDIRDGKFGSAKRSLRAHLNSKAAANSVKNSKDIPAVAAARMRNPEHFNNAKYSDIETRSMRLDNGDRMFGRETCTA